MYVLFFASVIAIGIIFRRSKTDLLFGQAIVSNDVLKVKPNGLQDAISDPKDAHVFIVATLVYLASTGSIFYFEGLASGLGCFIFGVGTILTIQNVGNVYNAYNLANLIKRMESRSLTFKLQNDFERSVACDHIGNKLVQLQEYFLNTARSHEKLSDIA
ncbi:MAG: hypothetical protein M9899_02355 [Bdellovibrionaceae bacterium]|nr:hypothetical protein [Pseudobdellovibrionaceae bacterium]